MPFFYYYDPTYVLVLLGLIVSLIAQARVQTAFNKYKKVRTQKNITGFDAANYILDKYNYGDIKIKKVRGSLSDYFNPVTKEIALSPESLNDRSVASVAVASHECGHVIQFKEGYKPLVIKSRLVPVVNFGSSLSMPLILLGLILGGEQSLINIGVILYSFALIFQLVTLPVEFDASRRALAELRESGMLVGEENDYAKEMLKAAAGTYVAATLATALQFLRIFLLFYRRDDN